MLRKEIPRFGNKGVPEIGITLLIARIKILLTLGTTETKKRLWKIAKEMYQTDYYNIESLHRLYTMQHLFIRY